MAPDEVCLDIESRAHVSGGGFRFQLNKCFSIPRGIYAGRQEFIGELEL